MTTNPTSPTSGIIMPQLEHQFRLVVKDIPGDVISMCVTKCDISLLTDTITIDVEQPTVDVGVFDTIRRLCRQYVDVDILLLNGDDDNISTIHLYGCTATHHNLSFNYAVSKAATHRVTMTFTSVSHTRP